MQEAVARHEEYKKSVEAKMALRQINLNPERPGYSEFCIIYELSYSIIFLIPVFFSIYLIIFFLTFLIPFSFFILSMNL